MPAAHRINLSIAISCPHGTQLSEDERTSDCYIEPVLHTTLAASVKLLLEKKIACPVFSCPMVIANGDIVYVDLAAFCLRYVLFYWRIDCQDGGHVENAIP